MKRFLLVFSALALSVGAVVVPDASAASAKVKWQAPTKNADGTRLSDLAGYIVYWGTSKRKLNRAHDVGLRRRYKIKKLSRRRVSYVAVRAYDSSGNLSRFSRKLAVRF